ncbi:hypothetical protein CRC_03139 [Cylindrospermopsis raciborskii CS-505]|nr:hypothetical protein CRC_03139 [Cylindrospermopsis raciborskii CS-505]
METTEYTDSREKNKYPASLWEVESMETLTTALSEAAYRVTKWSNSLFHKG